MKNNNKQLFLASFFSLIAAGVGFGVRGAILGDWMDQFGFLKSEVGTITGGGLTGFGLTIIVCSLFADKVGYKALMVIAFILHVLSAIITLAATPLYDSLAKTDPAHAKAAVYSCLYWGMFMFALANGICESVINPLVATLYPTKKTHYLNALHAGWPAGLIVGGLLAFGFCSRDAAIVHLRWEIPMGLFLVPTLIYGLIMLKEPFPVSEARAAGVSFATMLKQFAAPLLIFLLVLHAMVGYVELGTDSWITNIMNNVIPGKATLLFVYTSGLMFVLRFFAGPIVERINPIGLLLVSALLGCIGLYLLGSSNAAIWILLSATIYGVGKTFLWPTMLGVVGERFPQGGALTMGAMGAMGALSAGFLGGPIIGYEQDYYAASRLKEIAPPTYSRYVNEKPETPIFFLPAVTGLQSAKVGELLDKEQEVAALKKDKEKGVTPVEQKDGARLWWQPFTRARTGDELTAVQQEDLGPIVQARVFGGQMALKLTAAVPAVMAIGYLILVIYFSAKGGYKVEVLHGEKPDGERYTGGVEGPVE